MDSKEKYRTWPDKGELSWSQLLSYLEVSVTLDNYSDGSFTGRLDSCVLLLGVEEKERQNGGEERVREGLQQCTNITTCYSDVVRTVTQALCRGRGGGGGERERERERGENYH